MKLELTFSGARVDGTLDGKSFSVVRKGIGTTLEGVTDDGTFGGLLASPILNFCDKILDGANVVIDETDDLKVWEKLPDDVLDSAYNAMI